MSEWSNVPVLKTGEGNTSGGSNPPLPATNFYQSLLKPKITNFESLFIILSIKQIPTYFQHNNNLEHLVKFEEHLSPM